MNKLVLSGVMVVLVVVGPVSAADLPVKAPTAAPVPIFTWTGLYFGAHVGGAWSNNNWFYPLDAVNAVAGPPTGLPTNVSSGGNSATSWLAGAQIGYNYQVKNWVLGVEAEFSATNLKGANVDPSFTNNLNRSKTDFVGTIAGRVGYAFDRVMFYGKGGLAWTHNTYAVNTIAGFASGGAPDTVFQPAGITTNVSNSNRFGYVLGAGVEYALSGNWSVKAEYDFLDLGTQRTTLLPVVAGVTPFDEDIKQRIHTFKVGFNYKLDPIGANSPAFVSAFARAGNPAPAQRFYGGAEYLLWSVKGAPLSVPLLATSPVGVNTEGLLLSANSTILYGAPFAPAVGGNNTQNFKPFSGTRLTLGYWLDDSQRLAVEASGFVLQKQTASFFAQGDATGSPGMRVPVYTLPYAPSGACAPPENDNTATCLVPLGEDGVPVSIPDDLTGSLSVKNSLQLWGLEGGGVMSLYRAPNWEVRALAGVRYLNLAERFKMTVNLVGLAGTPFAGMSGFSTDEFATRNQFYGVTLGLRGSYNSGPFSIEAMGRIGLGVSHQVLTVAGYYQDVGFPFHATSGPYGTFAMPSNEGTRSRNEFSVVPEAQVKLGYDLTSSVRLTVGYDFLYMSNVIRPTDQIDRNIPKGQTFQQDPTRPDSTTVPAQFFKGTDFYAHGLNAGLTVRF